MSNRHMPRPDYIVSHDTAYGWTVIRTADRVAIYDGEEENPLTYQEAIDLAWAWNNGATDDDEAVEMIRQRDQQDPRWLWHMGILDLSEWATS